MNTPQNNDSKPRSTVYLLIGLFCFVLMGLFWELDKFFIYFFLASSSMFFFLSYKNRPITKERESSARYWKEKQSGKPERTISGASVIGIVVFAFICFVIFLIITDGSEEPDYRADIAYGKAYNYQSLGNIDSAEYFYRQAIASNPTHSGALVGLGNLFLFEEEYDSAWKYFDNAVKVAPDYEDARYNKSLVRYYQKRYHESASEARKILLINPEYQDARLLIGDTHNAMGNYDSAMYWYQYVYDAGYRSAPLLHVMAYLHDIKGNQKDAIQFYRQTLEYDSAQKEVYSRLGQLLTGEEGEKFRTLSLKFE